MLHVNFMDGSATSNWRNLRYVQSECFYDDPEARIHYFRHDNIVNVSMTDGRGEIIGVQKAIGLKKGDALVMWDFYCFPSANCVNGEKGRSFFVVENAKKAVAGLRGEGAAVFWHRFSPSKGYVAKGKEVPKDGMSLLAW
ncbi:MAG: hypothetical protein MJ202_03040 [Lentisphaeria bacterium]|nr:hypothetical protein [Lentisphaeria bacterium]